MSFLRAVFLWFIISRKGQRCALYVGCVSCVHARVSVVRVGHDMCILVIVCGSGLMRALNYSNNSMCRAVKVLSG